MAASTDAATGTSAFDHPSSEDLYDVKAPADASSALVCSMVVRIIDAAELVLS
jgi:hypothetical protein